MPREAWLRGPVEGVPGPLMPVAHALLQAGEDLEVVRDLTLDELWSRPGGAASIGFHLRHIPGSMDRLLTYAAGETLSDAQMAELRNEGNPGTPPATAGELLAGVREAIERALDVLKASDERALMEPRGVGRAQLPSTVLGLLYHVGEHTQRHVGQVITTVKIMRGLRLTEGSSD